LPRRNFQLRVRKSDPSYEELVPEESPITQDEQDESMTRYGRTPTGFQLRVRKAPTNFQLRVRKDDPAFKNSMDEKRDYTDYLDYLTETDLSDYANSLPEIHLPGILKLARKRNVGNFQLRV
jgi:hypothetical protein